MEFWVVVAAAGAGYIAQYLQSSSDNKDNLLEQKQFSKISTHEQSDNKNLVYQIRENLCPFRRLARKRAKKEIADEGVFGFRRLNLDSSANCEFAVQWEPKDYNGREHTITRNKVSSGQFNSTGLPNGMDVLYMGIITGMMSAIIANRREIEKVNEKLKWTKNLVQELQEELTVKENANDGYEKPNLYSPSMSAVEPMSFSSEVQVNEPKTSENTNHQVAENHESMSEIEAELEAELERLEMSLKVERISDYVEIDPEDEVDVAQGDFKPDYLNMQCSDSSESERDTSETRIYHSKPANYPVSPRELSLRLHEVIESRLEAQIKDLETALRHSQIRAYSLEAQHILSQMDYASSESESSAYPQSPYCYNEANEDTIRTMHGSETIFEIDIRSPPLDRALIVRQNMEGK
ncbi:PREDICTED: uncharacterized protein LOC109239733 [Nicotiana attenuata]|uniref:Uncharacterized protein n=1 Tax=Nicotiana attenuata TaxID=49451 RepID=A0A314L8T3_NICAT|nr:PREDICTED: uncharacterized protein LOC109239733 [Nicotiana attenuata]OIT38201.1 hypothetical protein A4A49_02026 [Nicotiana attenuata]